MPQTLPLPRSFLLLAVICFSLVITGREVSPAQESAPVEPPAAREGPWGGEASGWELVDRLVAVVDDDPIFLSDLRRARLLNDMGDRAVQVGETDPAHRPRHAESDRELLDRLIDRRLRLHEVERYGDSAISSARVEESLKAVETNLGGADQLDRMLAASELDRDGLRELLRRQLRVLVHVQERIGARIFVDQDEVRAYYDTTLKDEMDRQGSPLPPFDEVEEGIRNLLHERALNREIEIWTDELRREAKVVDLLSR